MGSSHQAKNLLSPHAHLVCPGSGQLWQIIKDLNSVRTRVHFQARH